MRAISTTLLLFSALPVSASVLMLDFGPTSVSTSQQTNSPYHTANPSFAGTTWNSRTTADVASGLSYADGNAATGIAYNLGYASVSNPNPTLVNLATNPTSSNALGDALSQNNYATGSPGIDAIYQGNTGQTRSIGLQVTGLAAGIYEIFAVARNTNTSTVDYSQTIHVGIGVAGENFDFTSTGYQSATLSYIDSSGSTGWVQEGSADENYVRFQIEITAGQAINLAVQGDAEQTRGFLNLVQIVQIPEPSSAFLALLGALPVFCRRRRTV